MYVGTFYGLLLSQYHSLFLSLQSTKNLRKLERCPSASASTFDAPSNHTLLISTWPYLALFVTRSNLGGNISRYYEPCKKRWIGTVAINYWQPCCETGRLARRLGAWASSLQGRLRPWQAAKPHQGPNSTSEGVPEVIGLQGGLLTSSALSPHFPPPAAPPSPAPTRRGLLPPLRTLLGFPLGSYLTTKLIWPLHVEIGKLSSLERQTWGNCTRGWWP
ncbi:hypothetical protein CRG98_006927 [Punica granatum]|uniref:Uncharacterized protein n=1 Tax=Punica granatum TaxID=22663 RepID=A0A2I0KXX0_PUNGR|nr:hypothetical protein CRG98_006927 [Punica granatum]